MENGPLRHSGKRPIKEGKRPIKEGKRPINANGQFWGTPSWWKTAPLRRPIKRSVSFLVPDRHSIAIAHFGFSDRYRIALRGFT